MQIHSFTIDLKYNPDDGVKILEIQSEGFSGSSGYSQTHDNDQIREKICSDISKDINISVKYQPELGYGDFYDRIGTVIKNSYSTVTFPNSLNLHCRELSSTLSSFSTSSDERNIIANLDLTAHAFLENKAAIEILMQDDPLWQKLTPSTYLFPWQSGGFDAERFKKIMGDKKDYVLKLPDLSNGVGLRIFNSGNVENEVNKIIEYFDKKEQANNTADSCLYLINPKKYNRTKGFKASDGDSNSNILKAIHKPVLLLQSLEKSTPVKHNDLDYDGTMRVFVSATRKDNESEWKITKHGEYWKLPKHSITRKNDDSIISYSNHSWEKSRLAIIFQRFSSRKMMAEKVSDEIMSEVMKDIPDLVTNIVRKFDDTSLHQFTSEKLKSDNNVDVGVGLLMALDHRFYPAQNDNERLSDKFSDIAYPDEFVEIMVNDIFENGKSPSTYLKRVMDLNKRAPIPKTANKKLIPQLKMKATPANLVAEMMAAYMHKL